MSLLPRLVRCAGRRRSVVPLGSSWSHRPLAALTLSWSSSLSWPAGSGYYHDDYSSSNKSFGRLARCGMSSLASDLPIQGIPIVDDDDDDENSSSSTIIIKEGVDEDDTDASTNEPSRRKIFRSMQPHPSILRYIQAIGVGIPERKINALRGDKTVADLERIRRGTPAYLAPPPFGPGGKPVKVLGSVGIAAAAAATPPPPEKPTQILARKPDARQPMQEYWEGSDDDEEKAEEINSDDQREEHEDPADTHAGIGQVRHQFPRNQALTPEIAFAGRSNVGKSTLLNAILYGNRSEEAVMRIKQRGRVPLAMKMPRGKKAVMSDRPGETREITFYMLQHLTILETEVENRFLTLVDLPGYGFAYAKEEHRLEFQNLMADYILNRGEALKRVLLMVDARHGLKLVDVQFLEMLQDEVERRTQQIRLQEQRTGVRERQRMPKLPPIQIVLTKCDMVSQSDLAKRVAQVRQMLSDQLRREPTTLPILLVSARAGVGYNNVDPRSLRSRGGVLELQKELAALVTPKRSPRKYNAKPYEPRAGIDIDERESISDRTRAGVRKFRPEAPPTRQMLRRQRFSSDGDTPASRDSRADSGSERRRTMRVDENYAPASRGDRVDQNQSGSGPERRRRMRVAENHTPSSRGGGDDRNPSGSGPERRRTMRADENYTPASRAGRADRNQSSSGPERRRTMRADENYTPASRAGRADRNQSSSGPERRRTMLARPRS